MDAEAPAGSSAVLSDPTSPLPSFVPDRAGSYTATLTVSDGTATAKDSVVVTTNGNRAPVARAGRGRSHAGGRPDHSARWQTDSTDANGQLLGYAWTLTKKPGGSTAPISNPATPRPTFTADKKGKYTFSLVTTDAGLLTASDLRIFSVAFPHADAGRDQVVEVGATVTLDGSASVASRRDAGVWMGPPLDAGRQHGGARRPGRSATALRRRPRGRLHRAADRVRRRRS